MHTKRIEQPRLQVGITFVSIKLCCSQLGSEEAKTFCYKPGAFSGETIWSYWAAVVTRDATESYINDVSIHACTHFSFDLVTTSSCVTVSNVRLASISSRSLSWSCCWSSPFSRRNLSNGAARDSSTMHCRSFSFSSTKLFASSISDCMVKFTVADSDVSQYVMLDKREFDDEIIIVLAGVFRYRSFLQLNPLKWKKSPRTVNPIIWIGIITCDLLELLDLCEVHCKC